MARIVILGSAYPLRGGGLATFNERLARSFAQEGHQVTIYTFSLQYPGILFPGKSQYSDEEAPSDLDIRVKVNSINPFNWFKVGLELKSMRPDFLIIRYWIPFMAPCLGTIAALVRKNKYTKIVAIADNIVPHEKRFGDQILTRFFVRKINKFVTMTDAVRTELEQFQVPSRNISVCPHPLYDNFGAPLLQKDARQLLNLNPDDKVVLFFGFIREYKGLDLLLQAFSNQNILMLGIRLVVAGEFYDNQDKYFELAKKLNLTDSIIWHTQFIPSYRVREYFCAADIVAQPYRSATQSGVTQIAYHFETPMLVTSVGGLPEMVPHLKAGYVVEPEPVDIAKALVHFFENAKKEEFSNFLKEEKKRFSWKKLVEALMKNNKD